MAASEKTEINRRKSVINIRRFFHQPGVGPDSPPPFARPPQRQKSNWIEENNLPFHNCRPAGLATF
jgi:hypothetical protein